MQARTGGLDARDRAEARKVLVVRNDKLGDFTLALPSFQLLKRSMPALELWAYVQSMPDPGRAIIGLGKRDAAFDAGLPLPIRHYRPGSESPKPTPSGWKLSRIMDQHAFLDVAPGDDLRVGDLLAFDISHPCLTFDKWRTIPVVDDAYDVIDVVRTYF